MNEHDADKVRLAMANGDDLAKGREQFTHHGSWLIWLREACELQQRQALRYVALAQHRSMVEAYLTRESNMGGRASIRGALNFISPSEKKPKKPKKVSEIETPEILGSFLDDRPDLFWQALQFAPELKEQIAQRLAPETTSTTVGASKSMAQAANQARSIRELLRHPTAPNLESARDKASYTARLLDPDLVVRAGTTTH
jgi:hypothetical protein